MLGLYEDRIVQPLTQGQRDPAPPKPRGSLSAEAVPAAARPAPVPVIRILVPVIMVAAMVAMVALMFMGGRAASPIMLIIPLMMGMSMLMMFAPPQSEGDVDETRRTYLRHLAALRETALANAVQQRRHELHRHPDPADLHAGVGSRRLWERAATDPDALEIRLGLGDAALCTPVEVADPGAAEDLDPVCAVSLRQTVRAVNTVAHVPVAVQLRAFRFLALAGTGSHDLARALLAQLVFHHGPETVGVKVIGPGAAAWEWVKWLPHTRAPEEAAYPVLLVVDQVTTGTEDFIDDDAWAVVVDVGSRPATALAQRAETEGLAVTAGAGLDVHTEAGVETIGVPDSLSPGQAVLLARALTRHQRPEAPGEGGGSGDLLTLLGVADVEQLTPETMWRGREGTAARLTVPIGMTPHGAAVRLDLKESAHGGSGPHGLCIGATGSGKSELLKTLVVALAATHSPDELNLVLVDFKGGATFLGCEDLPHTSAVITNLADEAVLVERMYDAISGEMNRRQEILREAGNFANVSDYTAARSNGREDLSPLPALLIIVDEFSELLSEHPDFADLFVAVGRLGRSLHVHLLLASQRLEEGKLRGLDSHLSYRIGLKTFSAGESRQVLGVTDAHTLPAQPGAGLLRTDVDDLTRFQAAYVSGPLPRRVIEHSPQTGARRVERYTGWEQFDEEDEIPVTLDESTTLLAAVVDASRAAAELRGQRAHRVWLDPLPARVDLAAVAEPAGELSCVIGVIDDPYHQRQDPLILELGSGGGHVAVCGGPQTGKTMALRTIAASLAATHTTERVRFYVIDFGGGGLGNLGRLPHTAGVADRTEPERIRRIVDEVLGRVDEPQPIRTFLLIDGWHALAASGSDFEDLVDPVTRIAADGPSAGVHLVVSTPRWSVLRPAIRDLITHRLELKLSEALDSLIDRKAQDKLPAAPGRGLTVDAGQMLIAYTATQDLAFVAAEAERQGQRGVDKLKVLPETVTLAQLAPPAGPGLPLGVGGPRLETVAWDPETDGHLVCVGSSGSGKSTVLATLIAQISELGRDRARLVVVDQRRAHLGTLDEDMVAAYAAQSAATQEALAAATTTLTARLPGADVTPAQLAERSWWEGPDIYVVIDDLDLIAEADLHALVGLLPHARDIGLHILVARKSGGVGRALYSGFLTALRDEQPAVLLLDADKDEGQIFGIRPSRQPAGRGTWARRGTTVGMIQAAQVEA